MASTMFAIFATFAFIIPMLSVPAFAQSGCTTAIISLAPCLNFITGNGSTPSSSCCSQLSSVVQNEPQCLCSLLNGGASSYGITINQTKALELPSACNVTTPPVSECNGVAGPTTSPPPSPAPSSTTTTPSTPSLPTNGTPSTPSVPSVPPSAGSKTSSPTSDANSSNKNILFIVTTFILGAFFSLITNL